MKKLAVSLGPINGTSTLPSLTITLVPMEDPLRDLRVGATRPALQKSQGLGQGIL